MNQKSLKKIYEFLERYALERLEYPCGKCMYFECKKNFLNYENIIRKRYKWNDIDWRLCLKGKREELEALMKILRLPMFRKWSYEACEICKKKFFKHDMKLHTETEIEGSFTKMPKGKVIKTYEAKLFSLCKKCNLSYVHRKKALHKGFKKL